MTKARGKLHGGKVRRRSRDAPVRVVAQGPVPERVPPPAVARESVEDPLEDWPEDGDDRWLLDRDGEDIERDAR